MPEQMTLEELKQQAMKLPLHEQLKLIAYISEQISVMPLELTECDIHQREKEADEILALCD